jgi:RNA polymerase sigma-70 factor (ECF subfamily)
MAFDCVLAAWRDHEKELRHFLRQRLGDADQADDLLQELFLKSLRQGQNFCSLDNPRAWLFQVARNALVDHARLGKPHVELPEHLAAMDITRDGVDELDACLQRNLARMTEEDRNIIEHCDLQGVKQQTYAEQQQLSLPAVKSRLLRARQRLRGALVANCRVQFDETGRVCCFTPPEKSGHND